jgi:KipI family sensor histidine kinase inhibitor
MTRKGIYVRYAQTIDEQANRAARALARVLAASPPRGVLEVYPGIGSTYIEWEDDQSSDRVIHGWIHRGLSRAEGAQEATRDLVIPIRYDGPDLDDVAAATRLAAADIAHEHSRPRYTVYAVGAAPGQPFLGINCARIKVPRRPTPRFRVPDGSVAIAGRLTTIYRGMLSGGWSLIGTALTAFYDPNREDPCLFHAGDRVTFTEMAQASAAEETAATQVQRLTMLPEEPAFPALRVEKAGPLDLVVDVCRVGVAHLGLAESGPIDPISAGLANELVGNPHTLPVVESTLSGPTLTALETARIAAFGPGTLLEIDGKTVGACAAEVKAGTRIRVRANLDGARGYLAIAGGFESHKYLGSASIDMPGLIGRKLAAGDVLGAAGGARRPRHGTEVRARRYASMMSRSAALPIRLLPGPQYSSEAHRALTASFFTVATGDRSGIRLDGPTLPGGDLLSESPPLGSVQVTSGGSPIILMNDRQRSAGYAKPAVIYPADLPRVAQLRPGSRLRFTFPDHRPIAWYLDIG